MIERDLGIEIFVFQEDRFHPRTIGVVAPHGDTLGEPGVGLPAGVNANPSAFL
jgi:hypothetical protein